MIISSPIAKIISFVAATGIVVGGMRMASSDIPIELEGAGVAVEAKMGTSFEDMAIGTMTAEPVEDITPKETLPELIEPIETAQEAPQEPVQETPQTTVTETKPSVQPEVTEAPLAPKIIASQSPTLLAALAPSTHAVVPTPPNHPPLAPTAPPETVTSQTPETIAPPQSMRPKRRDPEKAAKVAASRPKPKVKKPKTKVAKAKTKKQNAPRGNAQRNNTKGSQSGTSKTAKAKSQGTGKKASSKSGNAAVSNYPGQVMRRISRVRKPRVNSRGTATVAFSISSGGGLSGVSIARSSGSAALDKAAVGVVRKAAPFPKPPRGAKRRYTIRIKGR